MTSHHQQHTHASSIDDDNMTSRTRRSDHAVELLVHIHVGYRCQVTNAAAAHDNAADVEPAVVYQTCSVAAAGV